MHFGATMTCSMMAHALVQLYTIFNTHIILYKIFTATIIFGFCYTAVWLTMKIANCEIIDCRPVHFLTVACFMIVNRQTFQQATN